MLQNKGKSTGKNLNHQVLNQSDDTDTNLSLTFTQITSCVIGAEYIEHRRQSLHAKLERAQFERAKYRQQSFSNTFRNLFGLSRNQG